MAKKLKLPEKFTNNAMVSYLAEKNDMSKKEAKDFLDDVFGLLEAGAVSGQRVPLGTIGKLFVKVKPKTSARKGRNPATGEEITIAAKPATKVPKFTFTKAFKEASTKAKVKK